MADEVKQEIKVFVEAAQAAFANIGTALDGIVASSADTATAVANIAKDETNLAKMISDLKDQLGAGLNEADKTAFTTVLMQAQMIASRTSAVAKQVQANANEVKVLADSVPDLPEPPPSNG